MANFHRYRIIQVTVIKSDSKLKTHILEIIDMKQNKGTGTDRLCANIFDVVFHPLFLLVNR